MWDEKGVRGRLIAGSAEGMRSAVKVHSPQFYMHWEMDTTVSRILPAEYEERAVYVAAGTASVAGQILQAGQMAVLSSGTEVRVTAEESATIMVLGGDPVGERFMLWNFVSSSRDRINQAAEDWKQGRMKLPDADNAEFTPLPENRTVS